jgi:hypothetical protein
LFPSSVNETNYSNANRSRPLEVPLEADAVSTTAVSSPKVQAVVADPMDENKQNETNFRNVNTSLPDPSDGGMTYLFVNTKVVNPKNTKQTSSDTPLMARDDLRVRLRTTSNNLKREEAAGQNLTPMVCTILSV